MDMRKKYYRMKLFDEEDENQRRNVWSLEEDMELPRVQNCGKNKTQVEMERNSEEY